MPKKGRPCLVARTPAWLAAGPHHHWPSWSCAGASWHVEFHEAALRCLGRRAGKHPQQSARFLLWDMDFCPCKALFLGEGRHPSNPVTNLLQAGVFLVAFPIPGCRGLPHTPAVLWRLQLVPEAFWNPVIVRICLSLSRADPVSRAQPTVPTNCWRGRT